MTRKDRDQLAQVAKMRARVAKGSIDQRELALKRQVEDELQALFETESEMAQRALERAHAVARTAQADLDTWLDEHEVPARMRPRIGVADPARGFGDETIASRRAALRALASARVKALAAHAKIEIDRSCADTVTALIAGGLDSVAASEALEQMPTIDQLMLVPSVAELESVHDEQRQQQRDMKRGFDVD
jgi:hypothetical protein